MTNNEITNAQIKSLRTEAQAAGDDLTEYYCEVALSGRDSNDQTVEWYRHLATEYPITCDEARAICAETIESANAHQVLLDAYYAGR